MEKSDRSKPEGTGQEDLRIQDLRIIHGQRMGSDNLHSNQQLLESESSVQNESSELGVTHEIQKFIQQGKKAPTESFPVVDSPEKTKPVVTSSQECRERTEEENLDQHTVVKNFIVAENIERLIENSLLQVQDINTKKADEGARQECSVFAKDGQFEPARDSKQTAGHGANYAKQECDKIAESAHLEAIAPLQQKSKISTKLLVLNPKSDQSCEILEDNVKVKEQNLVIQEGSEMPKVVVETRAEPGARENEASVGEQQWLKMMDNFDNQQHQANEQQIKISHQENTYSFGDSKGNRNVYQQDLTANTTECYPKSGDLVLVRSLESKESAIGHPLETKEDTKLQYDMSSPVREPERSQPSKDFMSFHRRVSEEVATYVQKPKVGRPQQTKDYVTAPPRQSDDATTRHQSHETFIPRTFDNYKLPSTQWKDYVTIQKENVRMRPRPLEEFAEPRTHVLLNFRPFQEIERYPENPTRVYWPLQRFPKSEEPGHVPLRKGRKKKNERSLEEEIRATSPPPLPTRTRSNVIAIHKFRRPRPARGGDVDDVPLVIFAEGPEAATEPRVQRNAGILDALLPRLPTGIRNCMQRIHGHCISPERRALLGDLKTIYKILLYRLLASCVVIVVFYFIFQSCILPFLSSGDSPVTSWYYLGDSTTTFVTNLDVKVTDFEFGATTPVTDVGVNVNIITPIEYISFNRSSPVKDSLI